MAHRHPSKLNAEHVTHSGARRLLRAELANCEECRDQGNQEALPDVEFLDSLLHGFAAKRANTWRSRSTSYPVSLYDLAPPDERWLLNLPSREVARQCTIKGGSGDIVDTREALRELETLPKQDRALVLDDMIDGILEDEG